MSEVGKSGLPLNQIIQGDCLDVLPTLPDKSIDLLYTDPPYGMEKDFGYGSDSLILASKGNLTTYPGAKYDHDCYLFNHSGGELPNGVFHPSVKPLAITSRLIDKLTRVADVVLDPFLGSGTTAVACAKLRRKFIGIELNPEYCEIARKRVEPWLNQRRLGGVDVFG